jgi:hypothetical protein
MPLLGLGMAFGKKKEPITPKSNAELIAIHQKAAENLLKRAGRGGRIEVHVQMAAMATAHAPLAVSYQLAPPDPADLPTIEEDETG